MLECVIVVAKCVVVGSGAVTEYDSDFFRFGRQQSSAQVLLAALSVGREYYKLLDAASRGHEKGMP